MKEHPAPSGSENKGWMRAKQEHLRSNVARPHRNKKKHYRPAEKKTEDD